jgi:membrane-associated phospholipid phosphatase
VVSGRAAVGLGLLLLNLGLGLAASAVLPRLRARTGVSRFFGVALPLLVFFVFYREAAVALSQPDITWMDGRVARAELRLWEAATPARASAALGEVLALAYMSYVPLLIAVTVVLLRSPDQESRRPAETFVRRVCLSWAICYVVFLLVPVQGPRFAFPGLQEPRMGTGPFSAIAHWNQEYGMLRGAAFPSAHIAATTVALWSAWRWERSSFRWFLPVGVTLSIGALYLGYHYVADVLGGIVVGVLAIAIDDAGIRRRGKPRKWLRSGDDARAEGGAR